jgi:hypothetical protein
MLQLVERKQPGISKPGDRLIRKLCEFLSQECIRRMPIRSIKRRRGQPLDLSCIQILVDNPVIAESRG